MSKRNPYTPGAAANARIQKDGEAWTLVLVRELAHPPEKVWRAITEPEHLRQWAPFDADKSLASVGTAKLSTVGSPTPHVSETRITRADAPRTLEYSWGGGEIRWQLEPHGASGTKLTLWHSIDRRFIAMGATGWHVCFDVLDRLLDGDPIGRLAGPPAMQVEGWHRLHGEYAKLLGVDQPR